MRDYGYRVIGVICVCLFYTVIFCPVMLSLCQRFVFCICVYAVSVLLVYHLPSHFVPFCVVLLLTIEVPQVCRHYMSFLFVCVDCWLFFLFMVCVCGAELLEYFRGQLKQDPDVASAVAAIRTLLEFLKRDEGDATSPACVSVHSWCCCCDYRWPCDIQVRLSWAWERTWSGPPPAWPAWTRRWPYHRAASSSYALSASRRSNTRWDGHQPAQINWQMHFV